MAKTSKARARQIPPDQPPVEALEFATERAWSAWLKTHHASSAGIWLRMAKKGATRSSINRGQALEEALCYGWIDGQAKSEGAETWRIRFVPRRARSTWSKINRTKALALVEAGRMRPAGQLEIDRAQADGRWDAAYDPPRSAAIPPDLAAALAENPRAQAMFATLDSRNRYAILLRTQTAKKPETRARRIAQFVEMLARGDTPYVRTKVRT